MPSPTVYSRTYVQNLKNLCAKTYFRICLKAVSFFFWIYYSWKLTWQISSESAYNIILIFIIISIVFSFGDLFWSENQNKHINECFEELLQQARTWACDRQRDWQSNSRKQEWYMSIVNNAKHLFDLGIANEGQGTTLVSNGHADLCVKAWVK